MMQRRSFITLLGGTAAVWPMAARAQQLRMPVVGYLSSRSAGVAVNHAAGFRRGLSDTGYTDRRNVVIEYRWADDQDDQLPVLAADLVGRQAAVIFTDGAPAARAAKAITSSIPIVFRSGLDPVALGLVASMDRPSGNVTGVMSPTDELGPKRLEIMRELLPSATAMAVLMNPGDAGGTGQAKELEAVSRTLGLQLHVLQAGTDPDLETALATAAQQHIGALVIDADEYLISRAERLAALTMRAKMPAIHSTRGFAFAGGLISYGGDIVDQFHLAGRYAGRILKGEKPTDLPVQQARRIELIINMKTVRALGITLPITLFRRVDEVIE
jgi:putative tryptophan/tyrosine transport system substrate-binding protein